MQEFVLDCIQKANIVQLIAIAIMFWFFYSRLNAKIERLDSKLSDRIEKSENSLNEKIDKLDAKFEKLSDKVEDVDRRLCRIEGSLSMHGHCLFNQSKPEQKAN